MMAKREKKPIHKVQMTEGKRQIIQQLLQEYDIETAEDCIWRNPVAAFAAVSGHGAERVARFYDV